MSRPSFWPLERYFCLVECQLARLRLLGWASFDSQQLSRRLPDSRRLSHVVRPNLVAADFWFGPAIARSGRRSRSTPKAISRSGCPARPPLSRSSPPRRSFG